MLGFVTIVIEIFKMLITAHFVVGTYVTVTGLLRENFKVTGIPTMAGGVADPELSAHSLAPWSLGPRASTEAGSEGEHMLCPGLGATMETGSEGDHTSS